MHLNCLIVVLAALVVRGEDAAGKQGPFGLEFEFALFAEPSEACGLALGALAAEAFALSESAQRVLAGAGGLGGLALAQLGEAAGLAGGEFPFARETCLGLGRRAGGAFRSETGGFGGGLLGAGLFSQQQAD